MSLDVDDAHVRRRVRTARDSAGLSLRGPDPASDADGMVEHTGSMGAGPPATP